MQQTPRSPRPSEKAHSAFLSWRNASFATRSKIMQSAADILRRELEPYAKLLTIEMGKLFSEAKAEVPQLSANIFEYYATQGRGAARARKVASGEPARRGRPLVLEPLGVLLAVEPWNFPYYQIARIIAPQLSAGNTILLKHASNVPQCAAAFEKLMRDAGLPGRGVQEPLCHALPDRADPQ